MLSLFFKHQYWLFPETDSSVSYTSIFAGFKMK